MPNYDVAIVGAGLAGLTAAARLSHAGKKVVLTDPSERGGGAVATVEREGFRFSSAPNIAYGFEHGGPFQTLFADLGMPPENPSLEARYQVALPDHRVTISPVAEETLDELRREFPGDIDKLAKLYRDAGTIARKAGQGRLSSFVLARRSASAFLHPFRFNHEIVSFLDVQTRFFLGRPVSVLPLASLVMLLNAPPRYFPDGLSRITDRLLMTISDGKNRVIMREPWPELLLRNRRAIGIRTAEETIEARSVVVNASFEPRERTIFFGIREEVVPVSMERTVIALYDYTQPEEMVVLSLSAGDATGHAPAGMRTLTASFHGRNVSDTSRETVLEHVRSLVPFLADFTVITGEQDLRARSYFLPKTVVLKDGHHERLLSSPVPNAMKHLYLLPDSSRAPHQSLRTAHNVFSRLR